MMFLILSTTAPLKQSGAMIEIHLTLAQATLAFGIIAAQLTFTRATLVSDIIIMIDDVGDRQ